MLSKLDDAIGYFEKQRQVFLNKSKNIDKNYEQELEYCDIAIKTMSRQRKKENTELQTETFKIFWQAYPKKIGKPSALKAFRRINPEEGLLKKIVKAVQEQKNSNQWIAEEGKYIPHPSTWLNDRRWEDIEGDGGGVDFVEAARKAVPRFK